MHLIRGSAEVEPKAQVCPFFLEGFPYKDYSGASYFIKGVSSFNPQLLKHPQIMLRAILNSPFRGLLKNLQKYNVCVKIG